MVKWSIRDWWGKLTEKKELKPEVRDMLLRLDSVYEQRPGDEQPERADSPAPDGERTSRTRSPDR
jgi:hypothetical protein